MNKFGSLIIIAVCVLLASCGGWGAWTGNSPDAKDLPSEPTHLAANAGDNAVSLGWNAPTTNGDKITRYDIAISPTTNTAQTTVDGTAAIISGLRNDTAYTFSVTAKNSSGTGPAASIQVTPATVIVSSYTQVNIAEPNTANGDVADPSLLHANNGAIWLVYSGGNITASGQQIPNATRLAHSDDGGNSYVFDKELGTPSVNPVTVSGTACGSSCIGFWQYRTPWLIEDSNDPDATHRFKLFAHKYFFKTSSQTAYYEVGAIVMWTAATPDGTWSQERALLGWGDSSPAFNALRTIGSLDPSLTDCLWVSSGSASIYNNAIDFALTCVNTIDPTLRKIVLLRSTDHANNFTYVATLLKPTDALNYNAIYFDAPTLLSIANSAPVLIASPTDINDNALGCVVFPIASEETGKLFTENDTPLKIHNLLSKGDAGGGCTWDRGITAKGILMGDHSGSAYTLQATHKSL